MNLDQQIMDLKQIAGEKEMYERKLKAAEIEYCINNRKERELKEHLFKEKKDFNHNSIISIYYSKFSGETLEFTESECKYKILKTTLLNLKDEIDEFEHKLETIKNNEKILLKLYEKKEHDLLSLVGDNSKKIKDLNSKTDQKTMEFKELKEAIEAGKALAMGLRNSLINLEKLSRLESLSSHQEGFLMDILKHSHIDQAKRNIEDLKYLSGKFARELKDANLALDLTLDTEPLLEFGDWFYNQFYLEMFLNDKIDNVRTKIEEQIKFVDKVLDQITKEYDKCSLEISNFILEKRSLLI